MLFAFAIAAVIIYLLGRKSTACGVSLGALFVVALLVYFALAAQITYQFHLTPVK